MSKLALARAISPASLKNYIFLKDNHFCLKVRYLNSVLTRHAVPAVLLYRVLNSYFLLILYGVDLDDL